MGVRTSQVTTDTNVTLQLNPAGTGVVRLNKLAGLGNQPVGVSNTGDTKHFKVSELTTRVPVGTDLVMIQEPGGTSVTKCTLDAMLSSTGGIEYTDLSMGANGTPTAGGSLAYDNTTGTFTYSPSLSYTGTNGVAFKAGSTTQFEINIPALSTR